VDSTWTQLKWTRLELNLSGLELGLNLSGLELGLNLRGLDYIVSIQ